MYYRRKSLTRFTYCDVSACQRFAAVLFPYLWLFWLNKKEPYYQLAHWRWFDGVRDDARYEAALEKARRMAE